MPPAHDLLVFFSESPGSAYLHRAGDCFLSGDEVRAAAVRRGTQSDPGVPLEGPDAHVGSPRGPSVLPAGPR